MQAPHLMLTIGEKRKFQTEQVALEPTYNIIGSRANLRAAEGSRAHQEALRAEDKAVVVEETDNSSRHMPIANQDPIDNLISTIIFNPLEVELNSSLQLLFYQSYRAHKGTNAKQEGGFNPLTGTEFVKYPLKKDPM